MWKLKRNIGKKTFLVSLLFLGLLTVLGYQRLDPLNAAETKTAAISTDSKKTEASTRASGITAVPKGLVILQNAAFPDLANPTATVLNKLFTSYTLPTGATKIKYEYVDKDGNPTKPTSIEAGFRFIYVKITADDASEIFEIPLTVYNNTTTWSSSGVGFQVNTPSGKIELGIDKTQGKTLDQIKDMVLYGGQVKAWDTETGKELNLTVTSTTLPNGDSLQSKLISFSVTKGGTTVPFASKTLLIMGAVVNPSFKVETQIDTPISSVANAVKIFSTIQTAEGMGTAYANFEWVADKDGTPTTPVNTFVPEKSGYQTGYIKVSEPKDPNIFAVIPVTVTVRDANGVIGYPEEILPPSTWTKLPDNTQDAVIVNPINGSKLGFYGRGISVGTQPATSFPLYWDVRDKDNNGVVGVGNTSSPARILVPYDNNTYMVENGSYTTPYYHGINGNAFIENPVFYKSPDGKKLFGIASIPKGQGYVSYELSLEKNLSFKVATSIYNGQEAPRSFSFFEAYPVKYPNVFQKATKAVSLGNNSGIQTFMDGVDAKFSVKYKDFKNRWLSDYTMYTWGFVNGAGTVNAFGDNFTKTGLETKNYAAGYVIDADITIVNSTSNNALESGAPPKKVGVNEAVTGAYQLFFGDDIPLMSLTSTPSEFNVYSDYTGDLSATYQLTDIAGPTETGKVYAYFPTAPDTAEPIENFTSNAENTFNGSITIPRSKLPTELVADGEFNKTYDIPLQAVNETEGSDYKGTTSDDYSIEVNAYKLGANPIAQAVLRSDAAWNVAPKSLLKDISCLPGNENDIKYEFVDGVPDISKVGFQWVKVRMTDTKTTTQPAIIEVPLYVQEPTIPQLQLVLNDFTVNKKQLAGMNDTALKQFVLAKSNPVYWDTSTGNADGIAIDVVDLGGLSSTSDVGTYTATVKITKEGRTAASETTRVTVVSSDMTAEAVPQEVALGTTEDYWSVAKLFFSVSNVTADSTALEDYSVTLVTAPDTRRVGSTQMTVKVTNNKEPSSTVNVDVPVTVVWGNSIALGGSGTELQSPKAESTLAVTIHDDGSGPYLTSAFGNLPAADEDTALDQDDESVFYQLTYYDLSKQSAGQDNALEVTDGVSEESATTISAAGSDTPKQMETALPDKIGENGKIAVNYGDVLRVYTKAGNQRALYYQDADAGGENRPGGTGPLSPLGSLAENETIFVVITQKGFVPLYLNDLTKKDKVLIPQESTASEETYDAFYESLAVLFDLPEESSSEAPLYRPIAADGFKEGAYPKTNMDLGESSDGTVYVSEATTTDGDKYLKYAYPITFTVEEPNLYIATKQLENLSFGTANLKSNVQTLPREKTDWGFTVRDNRQTKSAWTVMAKVEGDFTSGNNILKGAELQLVDSDGQTVVMNTSGQEVFRKETPEKDNVIQWSKDQGFFLRVPPGIIKTNTAYTTGLIFEINDTPDE